MRAEQAEELLSLAVLKRKE